MYTNFSRQLWVAFKIWVLAVCANTIFGTVYLSGPGDTSMIALLLIYGTLFGAMYSTPVFIVLLIVINRCVAKKVSGLFMFRMVFASGLVLTTGAWKLFTITDGEFDKDSLALLCVALFAAITAIALQYKSLFSLSDKEKQYDSFLADQAKQ